MSPHGTSLVRSHCLLIGALVLVSQLLGCGSTATRILDSDVPQMPDMEQRLGFDIKRRGGELVGGVFIFIGPLLDMEGSMTVLSSRFRDQGWTVVGRSAGFPRSSLLFARDDRRVRVIIDADQLEPSMSRAQYVVSLEEDGSSDVDAPDADAEAAASPG